ncbi:MAG: hypothetical protein R3B96_17755 [Pirellulaceae bacterium]
MPRVLHRPRARRELTPHLYRLSVGDQIDVSDKPAGRFTLSHGPLGSTLC